MQDCYPLKPILFYPLTFLIGKNNKIWKESPKKNSLLGKRKITSDEEKKKTFSVFTFSDTVLCAMYIALDGQEAVMTKSEIYRMGFRRPHLTEDGELAFHPKKGSSRDTDLSPAIQKIYKDMERCFSKKYTNLLTERDKKRWIKNVMLFRNYNSQDMTDEELSERIDKLKGPVDTKTMIFVWNYVHDHEKKKYILMVEGMRETCRRLADYYNVPWEYETEKFRYVHDKMIKMLMKRENFEIKNIKDFATDEPICARWEFQRYLKLKRRSWADFTRRMERKWTKKLQHSFRSGKYMGMYWM
ncbi:phist protein [Plasmodium cynomolgi strain B]|uniref:Phist protein n=1 Tax=Plasmodium cynomolgi (strain B) TaxID=1120755 RepID=K6UJG5_PLACD|nr:phist protein [Plasmodium cynomolgi strain B]GAB65933.1 phist protein [Plasmodium cynomolgi strain B]